MEKQSADALDDLFVNEEQRVSHELLRELLANFVQLTKEGKIEFLPDFSKLKNEQKMIVVLLAKKALNLKLGIEEAASPKEIQGITGLGVGTVNPTLTSLSAKRLVSNANGEYKVPNYILTRLKEEVFRDE